MVVNGKIMTETSGNRRKREDAMLRQRTSRKTRILAVCRLVLWLAGCAGPEKDGGSPPQTKTEPVVLTVCIAQAQWDQSIDGLTELYLNSHPEVDDIHWNLVRRSSYRDLMNMKLATENLPDIMEVRAGEELEGWYPHLVPLDDLPVLSSISPEFLENGRAEDGHCYTIPQAMYGIGILYNMELLEQAGWQRLPRTRLELEQLCVDLEKAGIRPFMNPYHEISTWMECGLAQMISMKDNPKLYVEHLKKSNQKPLSEDPEWDSLLAFTDLTLTYGNRRLLQLNTDLARNYFYIGRYAMILGESARCVDGMRRAGQGVEEQVHIGPLLLGDCEDSNRLLMDTVRLGITKKAKYPEEAREFLTWLVSDQEALDYQMEVMGTVPVQKEMGSCEERLSPVARETCRYYEEGTMTGELMGILPWALTESMGREWARYITGESDRPRLEGVFEEYWKIHAEETKAGNK